MCHLFIFFRLEKNNHVKIIIIIILYAVASPQKTDILVTVVLQMFLVSVIRQHVLWVVLPDPLGLLNVKPAGLSLHLLPLPAPRNRCGEA